MLVTESELKYIYDDVHRLKLCDQLRESLGIPKKGSTTHDDTCNLLESLKKWRNLKGNQDHLDVRHTKIARHSEEIWITL